MKKLLCITICLLMILSAFVIPVSASEQSTIKDAVLHFDANTAPEFWGKIDKIYCHIWEYGGDSFYPWGNKEQLCTDTDGDGIYTYNLTEHNITLKDNTQYACMFYSTPVNRPCHDLLFDSTVLGDTAYCTGEFYEGAEDMVNNFHYYAYWRNQDPEKHGPQLMISSIGSVYGTCIPQGISAMDMFEDALINTLENARGFSCKTDQQIIDDIAYSLKLSKEQVERSLKKTGVKADWSIELSTAKTENAVLHFDTNTVTKIWGPFQKIYCHIWEYGSDPFYHWGNKEQLCTDTDGDGIYTYNLYEHNITLKENTQYACIFYSNSGNEHYPLLFDATVLGDTAYCTNEYYEGMSDSGRYEYFAYWRNQDPEKHGPQLMISSIGIIYGTCIPKGISTIDMFEDALINTLENARVYSGNSDQKIIDYLAYKLSLSSEQIQRSIENSGKKVDWKQELSTADKLVGDADLDGEVTILDATEIQLHLASLVEFTDEQLKLADIDFLTGVNILDVTSIQLKLAGYKVY